MNTDNQVTLKKQAVKAALEQEWSKAITLNLELLQNLSDDIPALNRLGFAYSRIGQIKKAKTSYQKALKLDKYNPIAQKSLQRLESIKSDSPIKQPKIISKRLTSFIEEPGKTKTVVLVRPGTKKTLISISTGSLVQLTPKKRRVSVETLDGDYLGCIPDDVGLRLEKLLKLGYTYETSIKAAQDTLVSVFIRELTRSTRAKNIPSFPGNKALVMQTDKLLNKSLNDIPIDVRPTGEDDPE